MNILQLFVMKVQEFVYSICFIAVNDAHRMKKIQLGKFKAERRKKNDRCYPFWQAYLPNKCACLISKVGIQSQSVRANSSPVK